MATRTSFSDLDHRRSLYDRLDDDESMTVETAFGHDASPPPSLPEINQNVRIRVEWSLTDYARREMKSDQTIGHMITITGEPRNAWATQCENYLRYFWPETGLITLSAIQAYIEQSKTGVFSAPIKASDGRHFEIRIARHNVGAQVEIQGTRSQIHQTIQQLRWIASSFRALSPQKQSTHLYGSSCVCETSGVTDCNFELKLLPLQIENGGFCWESRLHGIIASGFPTPSRGSEIGLEMSFDIMLAIACANYPVYTEDIVVFRGWKSLLYPTSASLDFNSIQWHIITTNGPRDRSVNKRLSELTSPSNWRTNDLNELRRTRSFLGYSKRIDVLLGTEHYPMQRSHQRSGAQIQKGRWFWQNKVTLNLGTSGMGMASCGVGGELSFSKTAMVNLQALNGFDEVLVNSAMTPVIMYDIEGHVAWLVPELSIALHATLSWFGEQRGLQKGELQRLPRAKAYWDGGHAASICIPKYDVELKRTDGDRSWSFLGRLDRSLRLLNLFRDTETAQPSTFLNKDYMYGWDLADLVAARDRANRKEIKIPKGLHRKWIKHIAQHPFVPVLFGRSLAPPILPQDPSEICRHWNPVPPSRNYLLGSGKCFLDLAGYCDGLIDEGKLTASCYMRCMEGHRPFKPCKYHKSSCRRLHEIVTAYDTSELFIRKGGAILIGSEDTDAGNIMICEPRSELNRNINNEEELDQEVCEEKIQRTSENIGKHQASVTQITHYNRIPPIPWPPINGSELTLSGGTLRPNISGSNPDHSPTGSRSSFLDSDVYRRNSTGKKSPTSVTSQELVSQSYLRPPDSKFIYNCRLLIMAYARCRNADPKAIDIMSLIEDGQRLYDQWQRQKDLLSHMHEQLRN